MMQHLDAGTIHELVDGEVASTELPPIQAHLATCADCRSQLDIARQYVAEADQLVDWLDVDDAGTTPVAAPVSRGWSMPVRNLAWAASVLVAIGVGYGARGTAPQPRPTLAESDGLPGAAPATVATSRATAGAAADRLASAGNTVAPDRAAVLERARRPERRDAAADALVDVPGSETRAAEPLAAPKPAPPALTTAPSPIGAASGLVARDAARSTASQLGERAGALEQQRPAASKASAALDTISFADAMRLTRGRLRLIDGMIPLRLELRGGEVRVVYRVSEGELVLTQQLVNGLPIVRIVAPNGFPADSVARLEAMVRN